MYRTFLKTQKELSDVLTEIIDGYYAGDTPEETAFKQIREICDKNRDILYTANGYGTIVRHRLGKKRMKVIEYALG